MKYFVLNKSKKQFSAFINVNNWNIPWKESGPYFTQIKKILRGQTADFLYFTDKTIIKMCTKIHFVMNLFPVSTHTWLYWPDYICKKLTIIQIRCVRQKRWFFIVCRHEISFFTLNYFCERKLAKNLKRIILGWYVLK